MLTTSQLSHASSEIYEHLIRGDEQSCHVIVERLRMQHHLSVMKTCEVIAEAFYKIGDAWQCSVLDVYREHVASQIGYRLLLNLRSTLSTTVASAPIAIGCTPEGDPYTMPTLMVELSLRELGFQATSLGTNLPLEMLEPAIETLHPSLCWVSVSYFDARSRFEQQAQQLSEIGRRRLVKIICGGQAIDSDLKKNLSEIHFMTNLSDLKQLS